MPYQALLAILALLYAGCSQTTTNTAPTLSHQAADEAVVANSTLPGNAQGNYVVLADGTRVPRDAVAAAEPGGATADVFAPLHDAEAAARPVDAPEDASLATMTGLDTATSGADDEAAQASSAEGAATSPADVAAEVETTSGSEVASSDTTPATAGSDGTAGTTAGVDATPVDDSATEPDGWGSSSATDVASSEAGAEPVPAPDVVAAPIAPPTPTWNDIAATPEPAEPPPAPRPVFTTEQVYAAAAAQPGLASWTVVPLAHFRRGDRHVVVAWPALNSAGNTVDATVVGICLEESAAGLEACGNRWVVRDRAESTAALVQALGGSDYEVLGRSGGVALDELGPQLSRQANRFVSSVDNGNRSAARAAAMEFVQLLPLQRVAFDNDVAQLLWMAARYNGRLEHEGTTRSGDEATLTFAVRRGWFRIQTIRATAEQVPGTSRWIVVSYR